MEELRIWKFTLWWENNGESQWRSEYAHAGGESEYLHRGNWTSESSERETAFVERTLKLKWNQLRPVYALATHTAAPPIPNYTDRPTKWRWLVVNEAEEARGDSEEPVL